MTCPRTSYSQYQTEHFLAAEIYRNCKSTLVSSKWHVNDVTQREDRVRLFTVCYCSVISQISIFEFDGPPSSSLAKRWRCERNWREYKISVGKGVGVNSVGLKGGKNSFTVSCSRRYLFQQRKHLIGQRENRIDQIIAKHWQLMWQEGTFVIEWNFNVNATKTARFWIFSFVPFFFRDREEFFRLAFIPINLITALDRFNEQWSLEDLEKVLKFTNTQQRVIDIIFPWFKEFFFFINGGLQNSATPRHETEWSCYSLPMFFQPCREFCSHPSFPLIKRPRWRHVELSDRHLRSHGRIGDCEQSRMEWMSSPVGFYDNFEHWLYLLWDGRTFRDY